MNEESHQIANMNRQLSRRQKCLTIHRTTTSIPHAGLSSNVVFKSSSLQP